MSAAGDAATGGDAKETMMRTIKTVLKFLLVGLFVVGQTLALGCVSLTCVGLLTGEDDE